MKNFRGAAAAVRIAGLVLLALGLLAALQRIMLPTVPRESAEFFFLQTAEDADCTLLLSGGKSILIDTGEAQDFDAIRALLESCGTERIDLLILTHPDRDHIGSARALIEEYPVGLAVEPYYAKEKESFDALNDTLDFRGIQRLIPARTRNFTYGDLRLTVYPPEKNSYGNDNNYSLAVAVKHGKTELFFAGDAYTARTEELLRLPLNAVDVYHASYHGRDYENGTKLLETLTPQYVIVTSDSAGKETAKCLDALSCRVFYTVSGTVHMQSDGSEIKQVE